MMYLSKGYLQIRSGKEEVYLKRAGKEYHLHGFQAVMWMKGEYAFAETDSDAGRRTVRELQDMGLVETEEKADGPAKYRILTRCVCDPARRKGGDRSSARLNERERQIYRWIKKAGIHLSVAELVFLSELGVSPQKDLLYEKNRQKLVELLYLLDDVEGNLLEDRMEQSEKREEVVSALMGLLVKKKILFV